MKIFREHRFIGLRNYDDYLEQLGQRYSFSEEKVSSILLLANLTQLLVTLIELSANFTWVTAEERRFEIYNITLCFPGQFLSDGAMAGTEEAGVLLELRTQIFVQMFLDTLAGNDWDEWNTSTTVDNILQPKKDPLLKEFPQVLCF